MRKILATWLLAVLLETESSKAIGTRVKNFSAAVAALHALAQRYIGPGTDFPPMPDPPEGYLIRIRPTRVRGMGPWAAAPG